MLTNTEVVPSEEMREEGERIDAEAQLIVDATGGDRDAISELRKLTTIKQRELAEAGLMALDEQLPEAPVDPAKPPIVPPLEADERVAEQANRYMVLGRGYSVIKHYSAAVEMYREAVQLDPHLSQDTELLLDIRAAIAARDAVDDAIDFALNSLGAHGADLIFDVYLDHLGQVGMTPVVARAMRLAKSAELMEHATPELQVALRLEVAKYCAQYRDIIPDAVEFADDRSLAKLEALEHTRSCGADAKNDCFICLRRDDVPLKEAIARAKSHPSPGFLKDEPSP
jgi:tetratricopeptide (TPR) repeat protein